MKPRLLSVLLVSVFASALGARAAEAWTLERAVSYALTNSPDARLARQRIVAAQAGLDQAQAAFWPQVQLQSSYLRTDNPMLVFGSILNQQSFSPTLDFNNVPDIDNLNVKGLVTVPLYTGGEMSAGRTAARAGTQAARHEAEAVRNALAFEVARAFHSVLKAREFIQATEAATRAFAQNLAIAQKRFDAGTLLRADVLDVEVRLAQAREDLVRARSVLALSERALRNLLGLEQGDLTVAADAPDVSAPEHADASGRAELAAVRQRQRAAAAGLQGAKGGYYPKVSAFGSLDYDHGWRFNGDGESWTAGALLEWKLWDGRMTRAKVAEARAALESATEHERKVRLAIDLEVEQARLHLQDATERLAVTDKAIAQAAESVELTRARFEQGLAIATQLIDAETALTAARVRRAEAQADRRIAIAALRKALGLAQLETQTASQ